MLHSARILYREKTKRELSNKDTTRKFAEKRERENC